MVGRVHSGETLIQTPPTADETEAEPVTAILILTQIMIPLHELEQGAERFPVAFGHALGRGLSLAEAAGGKLAEGAFTARALVELAAERNVEMPICAVVDAIVSGQVGVDAAIESLLMRPKKSEV